MEDYGITIKFFADDSKMYAEITAIADVTRLQAALDSILTNAVFYILDNARLLPHQHYPRIHSYTVCGHQLPVVTQCRDLGVIIANNCQPRLHINTIVATTTTTTILLLLLQMSRFQ